MVLWEPLLAGDARGKIPTSLFADPRVVSYWDPHEISGKWFGDHRIGTLGGGIVWDAYYAFAGTARWTTVPSQVVASGSDIIGSTGALRQSFEPLLD